jgi:hypothetical protein
VLQVLDHPAQHRDVPAFSVDTKEAHPQFGAQGFHLTE